MASVEEHPCPLCQEPVCQLARNIKKHRSIRHPSVPLKEYLDMFCKDLLNSKSEEDEKDVIDVKEELTEFPLAPLGEVKQEIEQKKEEDRCAGLPISNAGSSFPNSQVGSEPECITLDDSSSDEEAKPEEEESGGAKTNDLFSCPKCDSEWGIHFSSPRAVTEHLREVHLCQV